MFDSICSHSAQCEQLQAKDKNKESNRQLNEGKTMRTQSLLMVRARFSAPSKSATTPRFHPSAKRQNVNKQRQKNGKKKRFHTQTKTKKKTASHAPDVHRGLPSEWHTGGAGPLSGLLSRSDRKS
jgi:beta-galactosidase/beta-glucuronidase